MINDGGGIYEEYCSCRDHHNHRGGIPFTVL